ncbi:MAG: alkaline phosphatase family protein, partial [Opitutales bacterium]
MNIRSLCLWSLALTAALAVAAPDRSVVVIVWDGMRPDFISPETTPNLARLAAEGVYFAHHHPVYLSSTEVNGTALATGAYPAHSGIIANSDFRPAINPQQVIEMQAPAVIRRGDALTGGHYLGRPTVAEILHAHGLATAIAGSKQVALLHDRAPRTAGPGVSPILFQGEIWPGARQASLEQALGRMPAATARDDRIARDTWTTRALLGPLWQDGVPPFSLLWLAEPDSSQHVSGPGSPQSCEAIRGCDANLGLVLAELERRGRRDSTDILVVSDHGFSTISRKIDVAVELSVAGFSTKRAAPGGLQNGEVLVVSSGGSCLFYVGGHDTAVIGSLTS